MAEVFSISRNDNLIDLLLYSDVLLLIKRDDKYYDLFSNKEFLDGNVGHFLDNVFYIRNMECILTSGYLTDKELISGLINEDRIRFLSNKVNDGTYKRKRSLKW